MCDSSRRTSARPANKMGYISRTKWEYPIPKSRKYWKTICDEAERRLLRVRCQPSQLLSYPSSNPRDCSITESSNTLESVCNNLSANRIVKNGKTPVNSMHKVSRSDSNDPIIRDEHSFVPIISAPTPSGNQTLVKLPRNPKLSTANLQSSFSKTILGTTDGESFDGKGEALTLPKLDTSPPTWTTHSTLEGSAKQIVCSRNYFETPKINITRDTISKKDWKSESITANDNAAAADISVYAENGSEGDQRTEADKCQGLVSEAKMSDQRFSKYSTRCAYKALEFLTGKRTPDFKAKPMQKSPQGFFSDSNVSEAESTGKEENKGDGLFFQKLRKELKLVQARSRSFTNTETEGMTLKLEKTILKSIPSDSRSTSGPSLDFVYPEQRQTRSARLLAGIPKFAGFPRKKRDRCLPCIYKCLKQPDNQFTGLKGTESPSNDSTDSSSSSLCLLNSADATERTENHSTDTRLLKEEFKGRECKFAGIISPKAEREEIVKRTEATELHVPSKFGVKKSKPERPSDDLQSFGSSEAGPPFSPDGQSSEDEEDSVSVTIGEDFSRTKYMAACHAPTIFRPSLEPFRALRNKKPTTGPARAKLLEGTLGKKDSSIDEYYDNIGGRSKVESAAVHVPEKEKTAKLLSVKSTKVAETSEERTVAKDKEIRDYEKEDIPYSGRVLTKTKSLSEMLTLGNTESDTKKGAVALRRGSSVTSILTTLKDSVRVEGREEESGKLDFADDEHFARLIEMTDYSRLVIETPLTRRKEILEVLAGTPGSVELDTLCKEFHARVSKDLTGHDRAARRCNKMATRLAKLLVESKRYLDTSVKSVDVVFSSNQPPHSNPRRLRRILPLDTYNLIAPILGMRECYPKIIVPTDKMDMKSHRTERSTSSSGTSVDLVVHPPTERETHVKSEDGEEEVGRRKLNPYALFLMKPKRRAVTWRPLTESDMKGYDPDATLNMRARNVMNKICYDFCEWVRSLGGTEKTIDEEVLQEMFEIDLNAEACKAMQISFREMPIVATEVALTRNCPGASKLAMTRKHLIRDARAERKPAKIKAFGSIIPRELQFLPPDNQVQKRWLQCENVPPELEKMQIVWEDITRLESVKGFVNWLRDHPEVSPPEALKSMVLRGTEDVRLPEEDETFAHLELHISQIKSLKVGNE